MNKPFSAACERNKLPILEVLRAQFAGVRSVLEIGSGTGQHALYFAAALPHLSWQCSDVAENLPGMRLWLDEAGLPNLPRPLALDVKQPLSGGAYDAVFTANTLHIMSWDEVRRLFDQLGALLVPQDLFTAYGPFRYDGCFTSDSNAHFDASLRSVNACRGIRDFEAVDVLANAVGLHLLSDVAMPAHNRCVTWQRGATSALR